MRDRGTLKSLPVREAAPVTHPGYRPATRRGRPDMVLSEALMATVSRHVIRHCVPEIAADGVAQVLVVQGAFGIGKTAMIDEALRRLGADVVRVASAEFEISGRIGGPVAALAELREAVSDITARERRPLAVHFPDFDRSSLAPRAGVDPNINGQLGEQAWQAMIDDGSLCTAWGVAAAVIVDGNDFTDVPGSLLRDGRAEFFTLELSAEERARIVAAMFNVAPASTSIALSGRWRSLMKRAESSAALVNAAALYLTL